ncbi:MAG TPA: hypothetical protein ENN58_03880 [bacterium]|nr:hypothetical protein [bacterium]
MKVTFILFSVFLFFLMASGCDKDDSTYGNDDGNVVDDKCREGEQRCEGTQPEVCVDSEWTRILDGKILENCKTLGEGYYCSTVMESGKKIAKCFSEDGTPHENGEEPDKNGEEPDKNGGGEENDDNGEDIDIDEIPDADPECGNDIVEEGELCDGNYKNCFDVDGKYSSGLAKCNETCDGWITDSCSEGGPELYGFVQTQYIDFSFIRGKNTPEKNEQGVIHVHVFTGNYGSRYLAMETGLTTAVFDNSPVLQEDVVSIRDITRVGTSILDPLVILDLKMPVIAGEISVGLGKDDYAAFYIADLTGSLIRCIHGVGVGSIVVDTEYNGISSVAPEGEEHLLKIQGNFDIYHPSNVPMYGGDVTGIIGYDACLKQE